MIVFTCKSCDNSHYEDEGCIDGDYYGYCSSELCYGMCEYLGACGCICHKEK